MKKKIRRSPTAVHFFIHIILVFYTPALRTEAERDEEGKLRFALSPRFILFCDVREPQCRRLLAGCGFQGSADIDRCLERHRVAQVCGEGQPPPSCVPSLPWRRPTLRGQRLANAYIACWEAPRARDRAPCRRVYTRSTERGQRDQSVHQRAGPLVATPSKMTISVCSSSSASVRAYLRRVRVLGGGE